MKQMGSPAGGDNAYALRTDASGNVYTVGSFADVADMDPGAATFDLSSAGSDDIFISKLDAAGNFLCAARVGGTDVDYAYGVALDAGNNIFITGAFMNTADFDPSTGLAIHSSAGLEDIFVSAISDCTFSVGIREDASKDELSVYPNPAQDLITIEGSFSSAELLSPLGESILIKGNFHTIDISSLSSGIYLLRITKGDEQIIKRIIKN
jgi:hypothetical protein